MPIVLDAWGTEPECGHDTQSGLVWPKGVFPPNKMGCYSWTKPKDWIDMPNHAVYQLHYLLTARIGFCAATCLVLGSAPVWAVSRDLAVVPLFDGQRSEFLNTWGEHGGRAARKASDFAG